MGPRPRILSPLFAATLVAGAIGLSATSVSQGTTTGPRAHAADASWKIAPPPALPRAAQSRVTGVSCVSASACMAVCNADDATTTLQNTQPQNPRSFSEIWNGVSWTVVPIAPAGPNPVLRGLSCASATFCVAVGDTEARPGYVAGQHAFIETWDGTVWHLEPHPATALASSVLNGVACVSSTYCVAVGDQENVTTSGLNFRQYVLAEVWNGTRWSVQRPPRAARHGEYLLGVSCASGACMAVGGYNANPGTGIGIGHPLAERWDGRRWTVQHLSDYGLYGPELASVSCVSRAFCLAVGHYATSQQTTAPGPFAARWNGKGW